MIEYEYVVRLSKGNHVFLDQAMDFAHAEMLKKQGVKEGFTATILRRTLTWEEVTEEVEQ